MTDSCSPEALALLETLKPPAPVTGPGGNLMPLSARVTIDGAEGAIGAWRAGSGPAILYVHGWGDTHRVWKRFVQTALADGHAVILMDLPGHGISSGTFTTYHNAGEAILDVCRATGPVWSVVAHSFGCIATARAIECGLGIETAALIAPPVPGETSHWITQWRTAGTSEDVIREVEDLYLDRTGVSLTPFDLRKALSSWEGDLLFAASSEDKVTRIEPIRDLAANLPAATFDGSFQSGHRDMPDDPDVIAAVLSYLDCPRGAY
ncbi:hypothetical protein BBF93_04840 [Hyphomonas sp. CACIAM 19H1]|uniref:alpha/beta fold hydrolase n=1 Tax=Hyphomonas sp. CACIAM 19H1 TaxID=1873716 RepID=UPI000DEDDF03|nr:alpha/beta hydrolase [Hyphomonas sp. CACIAM 19H1]AXE63623.1 hypothetical protein BBF93_04840 [Hyphomonas sp. CACIAM 19H1]